MALERSREEPPFDTEWAWRGGALSGFVATVVTGVVIVVTDQSVLYDAIAGLYGQQGNLLVGWAVHLVHGMLFGALFALILTDPGLYHLTDWRWKTLLAGIVYALVLAIAGAGVIMPMWLQILGYPSPPSFPFVTTAILLWHLVYGTILGVLFSYIEHI